MRAAVRDATLELSVVVRLRQQGLGLGLYIAFEIARAHGGTLKVNSTPEETRFVLRIPAA